MRIVDFDKSYVESARLLAKKNYEEEREYVVWLPKVEELPDLDYFVDNGLGVAALEGEELIGFLCCYEPWDYAFGSMAKGTFSPIHAHGAIKEGRQGIYQKMYQYAAKKWINHKIAYHGIAHFAHDKESLDAFFTYGFGLRCIDAIRPMEEVICLVTEGFVFEELSKSEVGKVRELRKLLSEHLGKSPCFMKSSEEEFNAWIMRAEGRDSRLFVARDDDKVIAFLEVTNDGENFATEDSRMKNICGAYCLPEYRGKDVFQNLLNATIHILKEDGYQLLGVDFESFNPTAYGFWLKYFTAYTKSVVRRIDECAVQ